MDRQYQLQTLVEVAYEALKKDITERIFLPGQKIILREVSARYGISETPIKQALNRLIAEGIIESIPRRGVRVRKIKWDEIRELMDIRRMIETYHIPQVIRTFKEEPKIAEQFLTILKAHQQLVEYPDNVDNHFKNYYLDLEFHQLFVKCSGNKRLLQIYDSLGTHAYSYYVYGKQNLEKIALGVKEHEEVYQSLLLYDELKLRQSIEKHIANATERIYQMFKKDSLAFVED